MLDFYQIATGFVSFLVIFVAILYWHRKRCQQILSLSGIPGPQPNWLFGNLLQMRFIPLYELIPQWTKQYGRTWGYYEGPTPVVVTSDMDLLQEVFIKQFRHFYGRKLFPVQENPDSKQAHLFFQHGQRWKRLRSTLNPSFTESRMRQMFPLIDKCINHMLTSINDEVKKQSNPEQGVDIYKFLQHLTLDSICECAFGVSLNAQDNPNQNIIENLRLFFNEDKLQKPLFMLGFLFPEIRYPLHHLMTKFTSEMNTMKVLIDTMKAVIKQRREERKQGVVSKRVDLLQLLLDSEVCSQSDNNNMFTPMNNIDDDLNESNGTNTNSNTTTSSPAPGCPALSGYKSPAASAAAAAASANHHHQATTINKQQPQYLDEEEITAQSVLFLIAGYETSSTALAYCCHHLVQNPQILANLHNEIDSAMADLGDEDKSLGNVTFYRKICHLPYLEAVIWETLRYHPFTALVLNRRCMIDSPIQIGNVTISKNVCVMPDLFSIHFDEELWGPIDVQKFDPDRHLVMKENGTMEFGAQKNALAMLTFGGGPRTCIGQRFALMEIRACLVRLLSQFTLVKSQRTLDKLPIKVAATIAPSEGVFMQIVKRNSQM